MFILVKNQRVKTSAQWFQSLTVSVELKSRLCVTSVFVCEWEQSTAPNRGHKHESEPADCRENQSNYIQTSKWQRTEQSASKSVWPSGTFITYNLSAGGLRCDELASQHLQHCILSISFESGWGEHSSVILIAGQAEVGHHDSTASSQRIRFPEMRLNNGERITKVLVLLTNTGSEHLPAMMSWSEAEIFTFVEKVPINLTFLYMSNPKYQHYNKYGLSYSWYRSLSYLRVMYWIMQQQTWAQSDTIEGGIDPPSSDGCTHRSFYK